METNIYTDMKCNVFDVWDEYEDDLRWYIQRRVSRREDTEDILQTVLMKVTRYCEKRSDVSNIKSWLYQIAYHCIVDHYNRSSKYTDLQKELPDLNQSNYEGNATQWISSLISLLPDEYSQPLRMADLEGLKQKEVAKYLDLSLPATKSRIQRGRRKLKHKFEECGIVEREGQRFYFTAIKPCCKTLPGN